MFSTDEDKSQMIEDGDYCLKRKQTPSAHPHSPRKSSSAAQLGYQLDFYIYAVFYLLEFLNFLGNLFGSNTMAVYVCMMLQTEKNSAFVFHH